MAGKLNRGKERAGVIVVRDGRLALIKRFRNDRLYYVLPGGGIEGGESPSQAAQREAEEELGVDVVLGELRIAVNHREEDGSFQQQWYFDAAVDRDDIALIGPELDNHPSKGTYEAVWIAIEALAHLDVLPRAVADFVAEHGGDWPREVVEVDEALNAK